MSEVNAPSTGYVEEMGRRFLVYAKSVLTDRAIPDVRDGLKPVQRRVLLAMNDRRLTSTSAHAKCARIVGDTMGTYHPHGDQSIYDALAKMTQDFSFRAPLVDGHGAFGSIDGDPPAAMRYTEARLAPLAERLLEDLDQEILPEDYRRNFDESIPEPKVLPSTYPNLLVNGAFGIAVGMSTKILPHNPVEVLDLCRWRLEHPEADADTVADRLPGPDLPTGALVIDDEGMRSAYRTGQGRVRALAQAHVEAASQGRQRIVVTSLPWQVDKGRLLKRIAEQHAQGRYPEISELHDYSKDDVRVEILLKRGTDAADVLDRLYRLTDLSQVYGVQMRALVGEVPRLLTLANIVDEFLAFRRKVVVRRAEKRLREIDRRLHQLEAYLVALDAIDEVVRLIRRSKDAETARKGLMKLLGVDGEQAGFILDMPLRRLTRLDAEKLRSERSALRNEARDLERLVADPDLVSNLMSKEFDDLKPLFDGRRRSVLVDAGDIRVGKGETIAPPGSPCVLLASREGRAVCGQGTLRRGASLRTGASDAIVAIEEAQTDAERLVFTADGACHRLRLAELPFESRRTPGRSLAEVLGSSTSAEIVGVAEVQTSTATGHLLVAYRSGAVKRTARSELAAATSAGIAIAKPAAEDAVMAVRDCPEDADIVLVASSGKAIRFAAREVRPMGRAAAGVRGMSLPGGAQVVAAGVIGDDRSDLVLLSLAGFVKRIAVSELPRQGRGGSGQIVFKPGGRAGEPAAGAVLAPGDGVALHLDNGTVRALPRASLRRARRAGAPSRLEDAASARALLGIPESLC